MNEITLDVSKELSEQMTKINSSNNPYNLYNVYESISEIIENHPESTKEALGVLKEGVALQENSTEAGNSSALARAYEILE